MKVSPDRIAELLDAAEFQQAVFWDKEVVRSYRLPCGFTVTGRAACVDPSEFVLEIGEQLARRDAERQLWSFEGYVLSRELAGNQQGGEVRDPA